VLGVRRCSLTDAILRVLDERPLPYREMTARLNHFPRYLPADGMCLAVAQVREHVRRHVEAFFIDKTLVPHVVSVAHR